MESIRFGTFNIGQGLGDYEFMLKAAGKLNEYETRYMGKLSPEIRELMAREDLQGDERTTIDTAVKDARTAIEAEVEQSVATRITQDLDVICLQEVVNCNRIFIKTLTENGFAIYQGRKDGDRFSSAIALRSSLFSNVKDISIETAQGRGPIYGREIASVIATLKNSNVKLLFSSLHSWGFQLFNPQSTDARRYDNPTKDDQNKAKANTYLDQCIQNIKKHNAEFSIFSGDMNNNPENYPKTFNMIQTKGFKTLGPDQDTNINAVEPEYQYRKIDFIFTQQFPILTRIWNAAKSVFTSTKRFEVAPARVLDYNFNVTENCSDHKPVATVITITTADSLLYRVWKNFRTTFKI